jgi:hemerythrin
MGAHGRVARGFFSRDDEWTTMAGDAQRFKLDFPEMDAQHDYLYNLFDLIENLPTVTNQAAAKALLAELEHYIMFHFSCEERLMRVYGFPNFAVHQSDHERAEARFEEFVEDFESNKLNPGALRKFLSNWLWEHSSISDVEYVAWIKKRREALVSACS